MGHLAAGHVPPVRLALLGFGQVGRALAEVLTNASWAARLRFVSVTDSRGTAYDREGLDLRAILGVKQATGSVLGAKYPASTATWDGVAALEELRPDLAVELTPSVYEDWGVAGRHIEAALRVGAHVVSANKGPFALDYRRVEAQAEAAGLLARCEAAVCGAVPILRTAREGLRGNQVLAVEGVFNATTTFVLSKMELGIPFDMAVAEAGKRGLLESRPEYDLEGIDAAAKSAILSSTVLGRPRKITDIVREGITGIDPATAEKARKAGKVLRLVGRIDHAGAEVRVRALDRGSPLAVRDSLCALRVDTALAGPLTFVGRGGGPRETASAVIADIWEVLQRLQPHKGPAPARPVPGEPWGANAIPHPVAASVPAQQ